MTKRDNLRRALRVRPGSKVNLERFDPGDTHGHEKDESDDVLAAGLDRLAALQERIWAEQQHAVLVVLQGIDAAGQGRHDQATWRSRRSLATSWKS